jgi:hypothetical protein
VREIKELSKDFRGFKFHSKWENYSLVCRRDEEQGSNLYNWRKIRVQEFDVEVSCEYRGDCN